MTTHKKKEPQTNTWVDKKKQTEDYKQAIKDLDESIAANDRLFEDSPAPSTTKEKWQILGYFNEHHYSGYRQIYCHQDLFNDESDDTPQLSTNEYFNY